MSNDMVLTKQRSAVRRRLMKPLLWGNANYPGKRAKLDDISDFIYDPNILWPFSYWIIFPEFDPWYDVN